MTNILPPDAAKQIGQVFERVQKNPALVERPAAASLSAALRSLASTPSLTVLQVAQAMERHQARPAVLLFSLTGFNTYNISHSKGDRTSLTCSKHDSTLAIKCALMCATFAEKHGL